MTFGSLNKLFIVDFFIFTTFTFIGKQMTTWCEQKHKIFFTRTNAFL